MESLPLETLFEILTYLSSHEYKTLRLVSQRLNGAASPCVFQRALFAHRMKVLEVFQNISNHECFRKYVKEICIDECHFDFPRLPGNEKELQLYRSEQRLLVSDWPLRVMTQALGLMPNITRVVLSVTPSKLPCEETRHLAWFNNRVIGYQQAEAGYNQPCTLTGFKLIMTALDNLKDHKVKSFAVEKIGKWPRERHTGQVYFSRYLLLDRVTETWFHDSYTFSKLTSIFLDMTIPWSWHHIPETLKAALSLQHLAIRDSRPDRWTDADYTAPTVQITASSLFIHVLGLISLPHLQSLKLLNMIAHESVLLEFIGRHSKTDLTCYRVAMPTTTWSAFISKLESMLHGHILLECVSDVEIAERDPGTISWAIDTS